MLKELTSASQMDRYTFKMETIPGWFSAVDMELFKQTTLVQRSLGIRGDLLEIGAYYGRSAILLGYLLDAGEKLVICDLFDLPPLSADGQDELSRFTGPQPSQTDFENNYRRFHDVLPTVLCQPSTQLPAPLPAGSQFRFIHIDASHVYAEVKDDIARALELIAPGGIIVFDDFSSGHLPGVAAGVWEAVIAEHVRPICVSPSKMYAVAGRDKDLPIVNALSEAIAGNPAASVERHQVAGHEVLSVDFPLGTADIQLRRAYRLGVRVHQRLMQSA
jgi:SAM-dependent methyltransferase